MAGMLDDNERARRALAKFLKVHKKDGVTGRAISERGGLSSSAASQILQGNSRSPKIETLKSLAKGAGDILGRTVTVGEMFDQMDLVPSPHRESKRRQEEDPRQTPIRHYVGAGDEVHLFDEGEDAIDWEPAPPGFEREKGAAVIVRGESMRPIFDPGDLLFFRHRRDPPKTTKELPIRPVIVQIVDGPLYVKKLLPGTKKGRFHLLSINPLTPILQDQVVESFAYIEWVKPRIV